MATLNDIRIFLDFDQIVKVTCANADCRFNLLNASYQGDKAAFCLLKSIFIKSNGQCGNFEPLKPEDENDN